MSQALLLVLKQGRGFLVLEVVGATAGAALDVANGQRLKVEAELCDLHPPHDGGQGERVDGRLEEPDEPGLERAPVHLPDLVEHHVDPLDRLLLTPDTQTHLQGLRQTPRRQLRNRCWAPLLRSVLHLQETERAPSSRPGLVEVLRLEIGVELQSREGGACFLRKQAARSGEKTANDRAHLSVVSLDNPGHAGRQGEGCESASRRKKRVAERPSLRDIDHRLDQPGSATCPPVPMDSHAPENPEPGPARGVRSQSLRSGEEGRVQEQQVAFGEGRRAGATGTVPR